MSDSRETYISKRELEILDLISKEYTTDQIATMLFISPRTVETHRKNIIKKLGARNLYGVIRFAFQSGLLF